MHSPPEYETDGMSDSTFSFIGLRFVRNTEVLKQNIQKWLLEKVFVHSEQSVFYPKQ